MVRVQQHVSVVVMTARAAIVAVMQISARVAMVGRVRVLRTARLHVATKAAVKLLPSRVAVRRVNAIQNKIDSDPTL